MVRPERLELPTYWFEASRSIQLSYGRARSFRQAFLEVAARRGAIQTSLSKNSNTSSIRDAAQQSRSWLEAGSGVVE